MMDEKKNGASSDTRRETAEADFRPDGAEELSENRGGAREGAGEDKPERAREDEEVSEEEREEEASEEEREPEGAGRKRGKVALLCLSALFAALIFAYWGYSGKFRERFFPNTWLNGIKVSGKTGEEAEALLNESLESYRLRIISREYPEVELSAQDSGLRFSSAETLRGLIAEQEPLLWGLKLFRGTDFEMETIAELDEDKMRGVFAALPFLDEGAFRAPENAKISLSAGGTGFEVVDSRPGTALDTEGTKRAIETALKERREELKLEEEGVYAEPELTSGDSGLLRTCEEMNQCVRTQVNYEGGKGAVLDGARIRGWLSPKGGGGFEVDEAQMAAYVAEVASLYDTYGKERTFHTSWGKPVVIKGGNYGWQVNQAEELKWLKENLASGQQFSRLPIFSKTAASHGTPDFGDSYVEINLTAQHLYLYRSGQQILSSDLVSGNVAKGTITHTGVYQISYKQRNAVLRGENYAAPVSYWMPFNRGEGLHDAPWRGAFGGNIYRSGGSHGCVNLPPAAAKKLFENVSAGTPVIVYALDGTQSRAETSSPKKAPARQETAAAATEPAAENAASASGGKPPASPPSESPIGPGEGLNTEGERETEASEPSSGPSSLVRPSAEPPRKEGPEGPGAGTQAGPGTAMVQPSEGDGPVGPGL